MELINAVKAEVNDRLADFQGAASNEHGYGMLGWGPRCATLFRNQTEVREYASMQRGAEIDLSDLRPSLHCEPNRR
jgi:hypothetical protein